MATPFPNPEEARKKRPGGARRSRPTSTVLAPPIVPYPPPPALQVPTKISVDQHTVPGPSGIKQCYRTIKNVRRIPILQNPNPLSSSVTSAASASTSTSSASTTTRKQNLHVCKQCHKKFNSPGKLTQHTLSHTGELPFKCQLCDKRFNSKFKLVRHGLIHSETRPFSCTKCHKTFHRKDHLANHERTHNPIKEPYKCDKDNCNKQYTSLLSYKKHLALHSAEEGNLDCKICYKTFENKADIVYHLKVHAGSRTVKNENDKKFKCTQCDRKFFTGKDVRRHLVVHTGSRDFPCQFCKQQFGRKDHLVRHMKKAHPIETLQSSTPMLSTPASSTSQKPSSFVSKKGKGEGKKSKPKLEAKYMGKEYQSSEEIPIKQEQLPIYPFEATNIQQQGAIKSFSVTQRSPFLPCESVVTIKPEPIVVENIKMEENLPSGLIYDAPSTSKGPFIMPPTEPQPSTSLGKYEEFPGMISYIMPEYSGIPPNVEVIPPSLMDPPFMDPSRSESDMLPVVEADKDTLNILQEPIDSILIGEEELDYPNVEQPKTVLPTFRDTFYNSAQSPKPPQHPPK